MSVCHVGARGLIRQTAGLPCRAWSHQLLLLSFSSRGVYVWNECAWKHAVALLRLCAPQLDRLWRSFGSTSGSSLIREPLDWRTQTRPPRAGKKGGKMGGECSRSKTRANSHIITFPAAIFQLARYRSACKPLDTLCLSPTGLEATFCPTSVEISPHSGGGQARLPGKPSRYAGMALSWIWHWCAFHPLLPVFMVKRGQTTVIYALEENLFLRKKS